MEEEINECFICGFHYEDLDIHHVNGNHEDNRNTNRIKICKKCHSYIHSGGNPYLKQRNKQTREELVYYRNIWLLNKKYLKIGNKKDLENLNLLNLFTIYQ